MQSRGDPHFNYVKLEDSLPDTKRPLRQKEDLESEAALEQLQGKFSIDPPQWICSSGHHIYFICTDRHCQQQSAMFCIAQDCPNFSLKVTTSAAPWLNSMPSLPNRQTENTIELQRDFKLSLYQREEEMIRKMRTMREASVWLFGEELPGPCQGNICQKGKNLTVSDPGPQTQQKAREDQQLHGGAAMGWREFHLNISWTVEKGNLDQSDFLRLVRKLNWQ